MGTKKKCHKKLLQINAWSNLGSTGRIAEQIGLLAMENGWESYIAYGRKTNSSKSKLIKIGSMFDVYLHYFRCRLVDGEGLGSRRATQMLIKKIKNIKPDIIHLHLIHDHYLNYPLLFDYLQSSNIPVVWTQHDEWAYTGHCYYIPENCDRWKGSCFDCPLHNQFLFDRSSHNFNLKKKYFNSCKSLTIVPVSEWLGKRISESFLGDNTIKVIRNGIDILKFRPIESDFCIKLGIENKRILLGVALPWSTRKGLNDYFKLRKHLPDSFAIVLVGLNAAQIKKLPDGILGIPPTHNSTDLAKFYTIADVLLSLSYGETMGMTIAEAYACGTPVIVYDNTAQPEIVSEMTGKIVKTGDIDSLSSTIISYCEELEDDMFREQTKNCCLKKAYQDYNRDDCFMQYIKLYEQLISNSLKIK